VPVEAAEAQTDPPLPSYPLIDRYPPTDAGRTAAETMSTYLAAINGNDASTMCSINVFAPCEELVGGTSQSLWSGVSIDSASQASPSQIDVSFSGTTTQPAAMGPDGDTCTDWNLNYTLTQRGYDWLVTDSGPSYHSPC
jgi:hypothetical protein